MCVTMKMFKKILAVSTLCSAVTPAYASPPALPSGLDQSSPSTPLLPEGLGTLSGASAPSDTEKAGNSRLTDDSFSDEHAFILEGFTEARAGSRVRGDGTQKDTSIAEMRIQLELEGETDWAQYAVTADFIHDSVIDESGVDLDRGQGWVDLREANMLFRPADFVDVKIGRQVLTWGTGDLLFINDLFPKDWNAFLIGRNEEYLKAPSDAVKFAFYHDAFNVDVIYSPEFDSDRYVDGYRLSYFNQGLNRIVGKDVPVNTEILDDSFSDDEVAVRAYGLIGQNEAALYYYNGYWKSPAGSSPSTGLFTFPALSVYGASIRGPFAGGIANAEIGYYDSRDDSDGTDPFIRNSEWRLLIGYERELAPELTGAFQYYIESMEHHDSFKAGIPSGLYVADKNRQVITARITKLLYNQRLTLSFFNFWSPSEDDGYFRTTINYAASDRWTWEGGFNVLYSDRRETFYGQLKDNSNVYLAIRFGF